MPSSHDDPSRRSTQVDAFGFDQDEDRGMVTPNYRESVIKKRGVDPDVQVNLRVNIHVPSTDQRPFFPFEGKIPKDKSELLFEEYEVDIQTVKEVVEFAIEDFNK